MPRELGTGTLVQLQVKPGIKMITYTKLRNNYFADFGMTAFTWTGSVAVQELIYHANFPNPYRASKFDNIANGFESGYCDPSKIPTLKADGWTIKKPKPYRMALTRKNSYLVYCTINGLKYAWYMNASATQIPDSELGSIGVVKATENDLDDIVMGASFPRPPRVQKLVGGSKITTFCDDSFAGNQTWEKIDNGLLTAVDLGYALGLTI